MKNNKGITLISITITIIVIIILTAIIILSSMESIDKAKKTVFQNDFADAVQSVNMYNIEATIKTNNPAYNPNELNWNGQTERAENTARIEDPNQEDTIDFILKEHYTQDLKGKICIVGGRVFVKAQYNKQMQWVTELADTNSPYYWGYRVDQTGSYYRATDYYNDYYDYYNYPTETR